MLMLMLLLMVLLLLLMVLVMMLLRAHHGRDCRGLVATERLRLGHGNRCDRGPRVGIDLLGAHAEGQHGEARA